MVLEPESDGSIAVLTGSDLRMTMSAVGGPLKIDAGYGNKTFHMLKNIESGLWSGNLKLNEEGSFDLNVSSIDGAGNKTNKIVKLTVLPKGDVVTNSKDTLGFTINVYVKSKTTSRFELWDGAPYSQVNPQKSDDEGRYGLVLPAGDYYLEVVKMGYRKLRTEIFNIDKPTIINSNFTLIKSKLLGDWRAVEVPLSLPKLVVKTDANSLLEKTMPVFSLAKEDGELTEELAAGKPTVLSFVSSWIPASADQLLALEKLGNENKGVNVVVVNVQESASKTSVYKNLGGYGVEIVADPDGLLVEPFRLSSLPTHIFLDRKGIIKGVNVGFLDKNKLFNRIIN
jgi:thiol-disulfide isomerase/thioredoxin